MYDSHYDPMDRDYTRTTKSAEKPELEASIPSYPR